MKQLVEFYVDAIEACAKSEGYEVYLQAGEKGASAGRLWFVPTRDAKHATTVPYGCLQFEFQKDAVGFNWESREADGTRFEHVAKYAEGLDGFLATFLWILRAPLVYKQGEKVIISHVPRAFPRFAAKFEGMSAEINGATKHPQWVEIKFEKELGLAPILIDPSWLSRSKS